jgi:hypothetical protein
MRFRRALILVAIMVTPLVTAPLPAQQVVVCGADELFILDLATPTPRKVWSWRARERPELPEAMRGKFQTIAECKPSADGRRLLIADPLEEPQCPHGRDIGGVGGLVEAHPHMALRGEVVDLRGADLADDPRQTTSVGHVAVMENQPRRGAEGLTAEVLEALGPGRTRTPHDAVDFIALGDEELGQIGAVLTSDACDERTLLDGRGRTHYLSMQGSFKLIKNVDISTFSCMY